MAEVTYGPDQDLEKDIKDNISRANDHQKDWRDDAFSDFEFYAGRHYTDDEMAELEEALRPAITFNRIGPVIDAVHGNQINNEQDVKFLPRENSDDPWATIYSEALRWADDECDAPDEVADAFMDCIICGIGWTETFISYDEEPDGKLYTASHVPALEMGWDPSSKKRNLSDARYIYRKRWWKRKEAEHRWPEVRNIVFNSYDREHERLTAPHDAQDAWKYEHDQGDSYRPHKDEVQITDYQWWEHKPVYRVVDRQNDRIVELTPSKFEKMRDFFDMQGVPYVKQMKRRYHRAFLIGEFLLEQEPIDANEFTYKAITGKRDANRNWFFGIVKGMRDPQKWSNKFFAEMQDFMAANRRGGAFAEIDAFDNPRKAEEDWNRHDALIFLAPGGLNKVQERQQINYPSGLDRLMEIAISAIPDTSGINLEMLGMADRNQPGVLEAQRKRASTNILSHFFKSLSKYQRERGRLALWYIQNFLSDGRMVRIMGEQGQQLMQLAQNPNPSARYDIIVDEAPSSPNMKEETFGVLVNLLPFLAKVGIPAPPDILDYVPLPQSMVQQWKKTIAEQKPDPLDQAKVQKEQSAAQLNQAKVQSEAADAKEALANAEKLLAEARREIASVENDDIETISKLTS